MKDDMYWIIILSLASISLYCVFSAYKIVEVQHRVESLEEKMKYVEESIRDAESRNGDIQPAD